MAMKKRQGFLRARNAKLSAAEQLVMSVENSKLCVEGIPYVKAVKPPSCRAELCPTLTELGGQLNVELSNPEVVTVEGQTFTGYAMNIKSTEDVNYGYAKVRTLHPGARHAMAAWSLPGRSFHTLKDSEDDEEHGVSNAILEILERSNIENKAVFVVRDYDGTHIGPKRVDVVREASRKVLLAKSFNPILQVHQRPLAEDTTRKPPQYNKGSYRGRGGGPSRSTTDRDRTQNTSWGDRVEEELPEPQS